MTIHWCGTGLSAVPGLRELIGAGHEVTVWERDTGKAKAAVGDLTDRIYPFSRTDLARELRPGDVVVSMLPPEMHVPLATVAVDEAAHFVCSSYVTPELAALDGRARGKDLRVVGEVGLDPGIDHLMAHALVAEYRKTAARHPDNELSFLSYCGGVPKLPNAFRYKFSWSPVGVLTALTAPSRSLRHWTELRVARPWEAIGAYIAPLPQPEEFEVYPNRDSLPFIAAYGFDPKWKVKNFVRGTLRLKGWADAWSGVFRELEHLTGAEGDRRLKELSDEYWAENAYETDEPDRVVLCVELKAERAGKAVWHRAWAMDAWGDLRGQAMARLVSGTVALAVEAILAHQIPPGVNGAPSDPRLVARWLGEVGRMAQVLMEIDRTPKG